METELKMNLIEPIFDYVSCDVYKLPHTLSVEYLGRRLRYLYYYYSENANFVGEAIGLRRGDGCSQ